jgi:hypothetical protein
MDQIKIAAISFFLANFDLDVLQLFWIQKEILKNCWIRFHSIPFTIMSYPDDILEEEKVSIVGDSSHLRHQNAGLEEKQVTFSGPSTTVHQSRQSPSTSSEWIQIPVDEDDVEMN